VICENEPTSGFVLNKKVGDYVSDWNHRQAYVRVYDPRDFEFEITIQNLLYILENATSTKGKGLEGEFVYGWDGKDLVLIPCEAPDYQELVKLNAIRHSEKKISARDLKVGATYRTRQNQEWVYMGKFDEYNWSGTKKAKPQFWFYHRYEEERWNESGCFETMASVSQKLIEAISEEPAEDYADLYEKMISRTKFSPVDNSKDEYIPFTKEELEKAFEMNRWDYYNSKDVYVSTGNRISLQRDRSTHEFYYETKNPNYTGYSWYNRNSNNEPYYLRHTFKDIDEVLEKLKPLRRKQYLANNKVYSEGY
jgi:hypothetical protein